MRDAHENLKKIKPSDVLKDDYDFIIENFSKRTISETLNDIRNEVKIPDKSFSS
jgi:oligoribonuclease NrnB/cAMP/cGMP phosphodiesterase (DHH superfamily)